MQETKKSQKAKEARYRKVISGAGRALLASRTIAGALIGVIVWLVMEVAGKLSPAHAAVLAHSVCKYGSFVARTPYFAAKGAFGLALMLGSIGFLTAWVAVLANGYYEMVPEK